MSGLAGAEQAWLQQEMAKQLGGLPNMTGDHVLYRYGRQPDMIGKLREWQDSKRTITARLDAWQQERRA